MPLRLDIKKKLTQRTDRVKSVDISTSEPWVLIGLYTGHLQIWNYDTGQLVKSFEVVDQTPIRFARFITRKQWIICGSDDMVIRVYNVNTMEKIREFEAHMDYIRSLEIHPVHPYVLTSSDDMQIKMWDWEKQWANVQSFDGHSHYVMMVKFNPKDTNTFASASLDRSVKVWSLGNPLPNFSLEGHQAGVNCVDYFQGGDKPYIASGSDDHTVKIWDYQTKACVHTLQNHTNNVSAVVFHPSLPIILSGSEDGTVRVWHSTTYRLENTLNYGMERCWALGVSSFSNKVAAGFDEGVVVLQMGREMPVVSMDKSGKLLMATAKDIQSGALRGFEEEAVHDGELIEISMKSAGPLENHLQVLEHNSNGRFVVACGDGEYVIYTSQALRNKSFGQALDFGWSSRQANDYAIRDPGNKIRIFTDFKETATFGCQGFTPEALFGGYLVGVAGNDSITFYQWQTGKEVCRIEVGPKQVFWSEEGDHVCLACDDSFFVLQVNQDLVTELLAKGESCEKAFEYLDEIAEQAKTGEWVGDCFLYTNAANRLNYYVGGETVTLAHLDREQLLLGFLPNQNRVFLMDKQKGISSYQILESMLRYQTAVCRGNFNLANSLLPQVPRQHHSKIARFLEAKGFKDAALLVATDPEHKFELALQLEKFSLALELMRNEIAPAAASSSGHVSHDIAAKWKQLGDLALSKGNVSLAEDCALNAQDFSSLLLIYSSSGNVAGLEDLLRKTNEQGLSNIAFSSAVLARDYSTAVQVLLKAQRNPEAAFMALNFAPSRVSECVQIWKKEMIESGHGLGLRIAKALADPKERPDLFPGIQEALVKEQQYSSSQGRRSVPPKVIASSPPTAAEKRPAASPPAVAEPPMKQQTPPQPAPVQPVQAQKPVPPPSQTSPRSETIKETVEKNSVIDEEFATKVVDDLVQQAKVQAAVASPPSSPQLQQTPDIVEEEDDEILEEEADEPAEATGGPQSAEAAEEEEEDDDAQFEAELEKEVGDVGDDAGAGGDDDEIGLEEDWE